MLVVDVLGGGAGGGSSSGRGVVSKVEEFKRWRRSEEGKRRNGEMSEAGRASEGAWRQPIKTP
jgi:hypothetical protein